MMCDEETSVRSSEEMLSIQPSCRLVPNTMEKGLFLHALPGGNGEGEGASKTLPSVITGHDPPFPFYPSPPPFLVTQTQVKIGNNKLMSMVITRMVVVGARWYEDTAIQ